MIVDNSFFGEQFTTSRANGVCMVLHEQHINYMEAQEYSTHC